MEEEIYSFNDHYKIGDTIYYLRVMINLGVNEIIECKLRTVESDYIVGVSCDTSKQVILMDGSAIALIFKDRKIAVKESKKYHVRKVTKDNINEEE